MFILSDFSVKHLVNVNISLKAIRLDKCVWIVEISHRLKKYRELACVISFIYCKFGYFIVIGLDTYTVLDNTIVIEICVY